VDGPEPKTPADGSGNHPSEPVAEVQRDAVATPAPSQQAPAAEAETPQTASIAPTLAGDGGEGASRKGKTAPRFGVARVALALAGGAALVAGIAVPATVASRPEPPGVTSAAAMAGLSAGVQAYGDEAGTDAAPASAEPPAPARPTVWRVAQLSEEPSVALVDGVIARRPLLTALGAAGVSSREAQRVARSLEDVRDVDHFGAKDTFTLARDKTSGRVVAYEVSSSPTDVWQAREDGDASPRLVARKLDLPSERVKIRKAIVVGADLRASFADAGLSPIDDVLAMLDDALEGHAELADIRPGARLRLVATQERVDGAFARWTSLDAVEYFPASPTAPPVRVYFLPDEDRPRDHHGWYDAKGRQPYHGGWRSPVPLARIASRFNPHRMHPVLHVVMPHNGVDFAAPAGAPVYATAAGVVTSVGPSGPCGNKVEIEHPAGITSVYCHLSRFAAGVHAGQHVEGRQLIAYVGQTGRVTGPHLHFGIKRNGEFIDPMTLRLDGVRVVPHGRRDEFDRLRGVLDTELDAIPLPAPGTAPPPEPAEPADTFYEEP
jgi:murein DD-endopeptidase MepM/ murein hydrolase activator NlpD